MMKILQSRDLDTVLRTLLEMSPSQRRGWWVHMKIAEKRKTVREIALRHRLSTHHLGSAIHGSDCAGKPVAWSRRVIKALQDDLQVDLSQFLTAKEAARYKSRK